MKMADTVSKRFVWSLGMVVPLILSGLTTGIGNHFLWYLILAIAALIFHTFIGLPNIIYLINVYKNFAKSYCRGRLSANEESLLPSKAYLTWIDDNKHLNNGVYFSEYERGRRDWFFRNGSYDYFKKHGCGFVLTGMTTRFRREIKPLQKFEVKTKLLYFDNYYLYLEQRIISDGFTHNIAYAECSVVDSKKKKRASTESFLKYLSLYDTTLEAPQSLLSWIKYKKSCSDELRAESGMLPKA